MIRPRVKPAGTVDSQVGDDATSRGRLGGEIGSKEATSVRTETPLRTVSVPVWAGLRVVG